MMKKTASLLFAMAVMLLCMVFSAQAAEIADSGTCGENLTWTLDSEGTLTISGTGEMTSQYSSLWRGDSSICAVVIEEGVSSINSGAFSGCSNLVSIEIPDSVVSVGQYAFSDTAWYREQPDGLLYLENIAYTYKGICPKSVSIRKGTIAIADGAFMGCAMQSIDIPEGVKYIGDRAFQSCGSLLSVTIPDSVTYLGAQTFLYCSKLETIRIGDGLSSIEGAPFRWCRSLTTLIVGDGMTVIEGGSFTESSAIKRIIFEGSAPRVDAWPFFFVDAMAYYPEDDTTWTEAAKESFGETIAWIGYNELMEIDSKNGEKQLFTSMSDAKAVYSGNEQYIRLLADANVHISLKQDLYIDLNGFDITGVIATNGYKIYGMDSTTDGYTCGNVGYFNCVDEMGEPVIPELYIKSDVTGSIKRYLRIGEDAGYSFHRFYLGITHASIKPGSESVGYKAVFAGDEMVCAAVDTYGYSLRLGTNTPIKAERNGSQMQSGKAITLRIDAYDVENHGETKLTARVFMSVDGETIYSASYGSSMRDMMESINENAAAYTTSQCEALREMIKKYPVMQSWNVRNLYGKDYTGNDDDDFVVDFDDLIGNGGGITEDGGTASSGDYKVYSDYGVVTDITIKMGEPLTLYLKDANGKAVAATWSVSDNTVLNITGSTITGVANGKTNVIATYDGVEYYSIVRVEGIQLPTNENGEVELPRIPG